MLKPVRVLVLASFAWAVIGLAAAQETYALRLNLQPGQSYSQRMTTAQEHTQRSGGTLVRSGQSITFDMRYDVQKVSPEGIATVKATYLRSASTLKSMGLETFFDSATGGTPAPEFAVLASFVGKEFVMEIAPDGSVRSVSGLTEMIDAMRDDLPADEAAKQQFAETMKGIASDEVVREMMEENFAIFPPKPVALGESWTRTVKASMMFPIEEDNTWTLKSVDDKSATIEVTSIIRPSGEDTTVDMMGTQVNVKMEGTQSGTATIDRDSGWTLSSTIYQNVDGTMTAVGQSGAPSMPVHFTTKMTLGPVE